MGSRVYVMVYPQTSAKRQNHLVQVLVKISKYTWLELSILRIINSMEQSPS